MLLFPFSKKVGVGQSMTLNFPVDFLGRKAKIRVKYYYQIFLSKTDTAVKLRQNLFLSKSEGALEFTTMS